MKMNNLGLSAFYHSALKQNMTEAAKHLGVTQSALSQRISTLEDELETTLFTREGKSLKLTPSGIELLKYCHNHESLENELLSRMKSTEGDLAGSLRLGAYSSILRSLIIPGLAPFLRKHPLVSAELRAYEVQELEGVLKTGQAEAVITDYSMSRKGILEAKLGMEEYVVIESQKYKTPGDVYLDHGPDDTATANFFEAQGLSSTHLRRSFMGDVYGIIDGVEQGLGRAVMSKHLVAQNKKVKILSGFKRYQKPIILHYFERPYYPRLLKELLSELQGKLHV